MKRPILVALTFGLMAVAVLSGCALPTPGDLSDAPIISDIDKPTAEQRLSAQTLADKLVGAVTGTEDRGARLCMIVAGVSEVMTDRVINYDTGYAAEALGNISALQAAHASFRSASELFFETDIAYVKIQIVGVLIRAGKARVTNLIETFGGGFNVGGALDRAKVVARQAEIANAFTLDIQNVVKRLNEKSITADEVEAACQARIDANKARIISLQAPGFSAI